MITPLFNKLKWLCIIVFSIGSLYSTSALAYTCPTSVTHAIASGPVPNVDPPPPTGTSELEIDSVYQFVRNNNITNVKGLLSVMPDHMKKHYALVEKSRALHQSSPTRPNITMYSVDATFMLNVGTTPTDPLYEVVDMTYLEDEDDGARNGDWRFASIDFRTNPPSLVNDTKNGTVTVCNDCHGNPPLPIWGLYLAWNDIIGDVKGLQQEHLEAGEVSVINNTIRPSQSTHSRYHAIVLPDTSNVATGNTLNLPDLQYPYSLTNSTMEMGTAMVQSIVTRMKRSAWFKGLREEMLLTGICEFRSPLSTAQKQQVATILAGAGVNIGTTAPHRKHFYQAFGLDFIHENARQRIENGTEPYKTFDENYNLVNDNMYNVVDGYILRELAKENSQLKSLLRGISDLTEYAPCGNRWGNLEDHLDYRHHQLFVLKGSAR